MKTVVQAAAVIGLITAVGGGVVAMDKRYAQVKMVSANSQQIAVIQIENAARSGNTQLLRRLCDDFRRIHKWSPSACK